MSLYFMRHGDTNENTNNKNLSVKEASANISLSETGKAQARKVKLPEDLDLIVISDSLRTRETAEIVLAVNHMEHIPIKVDNDLHPWNSGVNDWKSYMKMYYLFFKRYDENAGYETKESLRNRLERVISRYSEKNVLIIAHSILLANYLNLNGLRFAELIRVN